jgi:outer membrane protein assembly factor BamB
MRTFGWALIVVLLLSPHLQAEHWPGWRGPRGDGSSEAKNVPVQWSETENVRWKIDVPGQGYSSPVVWDEALFVTSCLADSGERVLIRYEAGTGEKLWQRTVFTGPLETKHKLNSFASGTPATDGERVFVTFLEAGTETIDAPNVGTPRQITPGTMVVAAYDFDGNQLWQTRPGPFVSAHGFCSSPVLHGELVIVNGDHDGDSYIVALDKRTGEIAWKTDREHKTRSYVTPLIREINGRTQLVLSGSKRVVSLNPETGERIWTVEGPTEQFVASMVYDGSRFFLAAGYPTYHVMAITPDGEGDVTETHVDWHVTNAKCYVPSPVLVGPYLLVADDHGIGNCFDARTGERLWRARLGRHFSASLMTSNGLAYFLADDGLMTVLRPGDEEPEVLARNQLEGDFYASPALAPGRIYLRSTESLYCIGD